MPQTRQTGSKRRRCTRAGSSAAALLLLISCVPPSTMLAGDASDSTNGNTNENSGGSNDAQRISFAADLVPLFTARCFECHRRNGLADRSGISLRFNEEEAYASLVNQPSSQSPDWTRVVPGDPLNSLLYHKVSEDDPPVGSRMPLNRTPLDAAQIELIRRWIAEGALNN
ncbi:hypothetical protein RAS1_01970 [Phycisphaerae bacterium RAS1]|nr:hypothetical protein RAS1_01970 [Phycisphaerae bacterium RAS1]